MKRTIALWLSIMLCLLLAACSQDSSDLLKVPVSANDCKGKNYQDVVNDISAAGFVNIQTKTIEDLVTGWLTKDGEVEEVTIDGDGSFRAGDTFDKTVAIIVSYHIPMIHHSFFYIKSLWNLSRSFLSINKHIIHFHVIPANLKISRRDLF